MDARCRLTGITGGIGSGKSVVSRILRLEGFPVYDCDSRAKSLMGTDSLLRTELTAILGEGCYHKESGKLNRKYVSDIIFADPEKRGEVNALVHASVRKDLTCWLNSLRNEKRAFVESAILFSSGLCDMTDDIILVEAPESLKLERICSRDKCEEISARQRMEAQKIEFSSTDRYDIRIIINNDTASLLDQVLNELKN